MQKSSTILINYRISVVCSQFPPITSGYAKVAYAIVKGLENLGNDVNIVTGSSGCKRVWNVPFLTNEGKRKIKSSEVAVIIGPSPPFTEQAFKVAYRKEIPVVYITNAFVGVSSYIDNILTRLTDSLYEKIIYKNHLNKSTFVFAQTDGFARHLNLKKTVLVAPYGTTTLPETPHIRKERRVLFVGQFRHYKGIRFLLNAAKIMKTNGYPPKIDIAGSGPLLAWMRSKVKKYGLLDEVNIITSPDDATIAKLYARDSVFVLPSVSAESFGFVLLEAASHGMSIIATDLPGLADVARFLGGRVVQRGNASDLAEIIAETLNSGTHEVADLSSFNWERNIRILESAVDIAVTNKEDYFHAISAEN